MDWLQKRVCCRTVLLPAVLLLLLVTETTRGQQSGWPFTSVPGNAPTTPRGGRGAWPAEGPQGSPLTTPGAPGGQTAPSSPLPDAKPTIAVLEPVNGATLNSTTLRVIISFGGLMVEPSVFRIAIDGADKTHLFAMTQSGASATIGPLSEGQHEITAAIGDQVGRGATALARFAIDLTSGDLSPIELAFAQAVARTTVPDPRLPDPRLQDPKLQDSAQPMLKPQDLRQFGYELFRSLSTTFAPVSDVPVGADYVLGPGDTLQVYMWGMMDNVLTLPVNQRGEIFLPKVGTFAVRGMALGEVRRLLQEQLSRQFSGFRLSMTLSELRSLQVFVLGEVARPGVYTVSSLSTLTNALFAAGGPTKMGSLRNLQLIRSNRPVGTLDLYDFLLRGDRSRDFRLESGDTIFVPTIGPVVAIAGNVKRPAIFELKGETRIHDVLQQMAGGVTPTGYLQRVQVERVKAHEEKVILDFSLAAFYRSGTPQDNVVVEEGDLIKIFPIDTTVYNAVTLEGYVRRPGAYELKSGMRLSTLVRPVEVLPEAYLERVEIIRTNPDFSREVMSTNLRLLWQGDHSRDIVLEAKDRIVITSEARPSGAVSLGGEVKRPAIYPIVQGEQLSSVLKRAGGFTGDAYLKGAVFTRERLRVQQQAELERFISSQEEALLQESTRSTAGALELATGSREEAALLQQSVQQRRQLLELLRTKVVLGRMVVKLDDPMQIEGSSSDVVLEGGDALTIPKRPSSVLVFGSVRNPTAVVYEPGRDVEYYLTRAGGLTKEADKDELHVVKADGSAQAGFLKLRKIEPGDIIVAPSKLEAKVRTLPVVKDLATILGQFALTAGVLGALF